MDQLKTLFYNIQTHAPIQKQHETFYLIKYIEQLKTDFEAAGFFRLNCATFLKLFSSVAVILIPALQAHILH